MGNTHSREELSIAAVPTVSESHSATPNDPQASLRAELLGRLAAAQFEIDTAMLALRAAGDASGLRQAEAGSADLAALQSRIATAGPAGLAQLRNEVVAMVSSTKAEAQRAIGTAAARESEAAQELATARSEARRQVELTMSGMRDFDPYLRFASHEDEERYRQREAERRKYIDGEKAKGTPQGDLNAVNAAVAQLEDAGAHGAKDTLGRFMQTDPIGYGDGMNVHAYTKNDPVNRVDPSGLLAAGCTEVTGSHIPDCSGREAAKKYVLNNYTTSSDSAESDAINAIAAYLVGNNSLTSTINSLINAGIFSRSDGVNQVPTRVVLIESQNQGYRTVFTYGVLDQDGYIVNNYYAFEHVSGNFHDLGFNPNWESDHGTGVFKDDIGYESPYGHPNDHGNLQIYQQFSISTITGVYDPDTIFLHELQIRQGDILVNSLKIIHE